MNTQRAFQRMSRRGVRTMRQGRRDFLTIMGGAGAACLAAACGGSSSKPTATTVATRAAATTAAPTAAAAASTARAATPSSTAAPAAVRSTPAGPVSVSTVTYIGADSATDEGVWHKKFNDDFAAAFPQHRATDSEYSTGTDYYPKLQTALATNSVPDYLFRNNGNDLPTLWDQGLLSPLNDVMEDVYTIAGGKDKFSKAAVNTFTTSSGEVFGMPMVANAFVWWFRQDLLQAAGLTRPADHWDWNFLLKAVKAVHKPPNVYGLSMTLAHNQALESFVVTQILGNGGHFVSADLKDVLFDSPEVRDAIDLVKELAQYVPPGATTWANPDLVDAIVKGTCAMGGYYGRVFSNLVTMNPSLIGKMSNTFIPYSKVTRAYGGATAHALFKGAKNPQGAKEMMKFGMRKEQCISYLLITPGSLLPLIPTYGTDPSYTNNAVLKAFDPKMLATFNDSGRDRGDFLNEGPGWKTNPKVGALSGSLFLQDVVQKVTVGKESTQSAVTFGANAIREIMKG